MSSRLVFAPNRAKPSLAASRMRSRFSAASVRSFRLACSADFLGIKNKCNRSQSPVIKAFGDTLRFTEAEGGPSRTANQEKGYDEKKAPGRKFPIAGLDTVCRTNGLRGHAAGGPSCLGASA